MNFLIWGVEEKGFVIPGLETEEQGTAGQSNCSKAKATAVEMLAKCEGALTGKAMTPESHFYQRGTEEAGVGGGE